MSLMPTAPRSIGGVLDDAIRLYRRALVPCLPIALVATLLMAVPQWLLLERMQQVTADAVRDPTAMFAIYASPAIWGSYLVILVASCVLYGALFVRVSSIAKGEDSTLGAAVGQGLVRAPAMLGVAMLFVLMVAIGMVLLIVPGIWLWGVFQLAFVPVVVERAGVLESLGISRRLVKGNWWRTSATVFVAFVILYVLMLVLAIATGIFAAMSSGAAAAASVSGAPMLQLVVSSILNLFLVAFLPCIYLAVYHDLKLRHEGADLADRIGALKPS